MTRISYVRLNLQDSGSHLDAAIVECFRDVQAWPPANEWLKCQSCRTKVGKNKRAFLSIYGYCCERCRRPLVEFHERSELWKKLQEEITEKTTCWVATTNYETIVGYCWGYQLDLPELAKRLKIGPERFTDHTNRKIAYQTIIGVAEEFRTRGIGRELFRLRLTDFLEKGLDYGIATIPCRDNWRAFEWYRKMGYEILHHCMQDLPDTCDRFVLGRDLSGLISLL